MNAKHQVAFVRDGINDTIRAANYRETGNRMTIRVVATAAIVIAFTNTGQSAFSHENAAAAIIEKGIAALGGEQVLSKARIITWKSKVTVSEYTTTRPDSVVSGGKNKRMSGVTTARGLDQFRLDIEGDDDEFKFEATRVVNGDNGWHRFGEFRTEMDAETVAIEKCGIYRIIAAATLVPIKQNGFKILLAGDEDIGGKPARGILVIGPDAKEFRLYFDMESNLPIKQVSLDKIKDGEVLTETIFSAYKEFAGIKKATKIEHKISGKRSTLLSEEITDFQVLDSVPESFPEPK